jgi:hypothetical protein
MEKASLPAGLSPSSPLALGRCSLDSRCGCVAAAGTAAPLAELSKQNYAISILSTFNILYMYRYFNVMKNFVFI